jgi:hypothetical protein
MSAILQVIDLVVNGPIKASKRARRIVDHFQDYKGLYYAEYLKPKEQRK